MRFLGWLLLAGTLLALSPGTVPAQSQGGPWQVGVLWDAKTLPPRILPLADWLREDLRALGFAEKEIDLVVRQAEDPRGLRDAARDLIKEKVNAIWASTPPAALAAKAETREVPIVFGMAAADPVQLGLVEGLAKPGRNVTGIAFREWHLSAAGDSEGDGPAPPARPRPRGPRLSRHAFHPRGAS